MNYLAGTCNFLCVYRYRLWIKVWKAWSSLVDISRIAHMKEKLANELYQRRLQQRVWVHWQRYVRTQHAHREKVGVASWFHQGQVKR